MTHSNFRGLAFLILALLLGVSRTAHAETYSTCSGFITSLPAVIGTQGTWCLKQDLSTAITVGSAITINTNNVTIDCNDFKLGGLAAGSATFALGIYAKNLLNATVRHCNVRGFLRGVYFEGASGGGHVVEDSRFDGNTYRGMHVEGDGSIVRRNRVSDTGGTTLAPDAFGIFTLYSVSVVDNTVSGVLATTSANGSAYGIYTSVNSGARVVGNDVSGIVKDGTGIAYGIYNNSSDRISLRSNDIFGDGSAASTGLRCTNSNGRAFDNEISGFVNGITGCGNAGGNDITP
jgi:nitrous oxidase accessory protein NosD